jgi:hypothetical protein
MASLIEEKLAGLKFLSKPATGHQLKIMIESVSGGKRADN